MNNNDHAVCNKIDEIASILLKEPLNHGIGLYSGNAGIALFLFYYARFKNAADIHKQASEILDHLFIQVEETKQQLFSLCSGIAGVGWLLDHLCKQEFIQADPEEMVSGIDKYLFTVAINELNRGNFDFLHGAMGVALYFVKRNRQDYLSYMLKTLANIAIWDGDRAKWQSVIKHEEGIKGFNIALSHGSSSIALVLCKALQILPNEELKALLKGAVTYILDQEIPVKQYGSFFPGFSKESQPDISKTRLAWCYGDLGVALAICQSGMMLKNDSWIDKGMEVLLHSANRRGLLENMVKDAGICHGSAGVAHIFNRLYRNTKRAVFKEAAQYWVIETLKMARFKDGYAGYKTWHTEDYGGWQNSKTLLEGIAGIGLCLLSFVMHEDPAWDECLLLS